MEPVLYCLSHVYSQLRGSWPGQPKAAPFLLREFSQSLPTGLFQMTESDWSEVVGALLAHGPDVLPWLAPWCREKDPGGLRLVAATVRHLREAEYEGAHYIPYCDDRYPPLLRFIPDPPFAVTVTGDVSLLTRRCISIIGSRKASVFALQESFQLARQLSDLGYVVVSGGAFGCDLAAHQGVLVGQSDPALTVSVAASGLARLYPTHNLHVFDHIRDRKGVFLSERLFWEGCRPRDFAVRNRIISGMSMATCVMQAAMKSGALLTAKHSLEHGREVLVLRHPEYDVRADGSRWLVDDGATAFSSSAELSLCLARADGLFGAEHKAAPGTSALSLPDY